MISIIANRCGRIQEKHFEGKKTLRNFRDTLEKRLLRWGNEKSGLHKTVQKKSRGKDAAVSDLQESMTVELEGYYDGEVFMATRVIMEEDV